MDTTSKTIRKENPRKSANPLSKILFWYTLPTFRKGLKRDLEEEDLYEPLKYHLSNVLGDKLETAWNREKSSHQNPSLLRALGRVFYKKFIYFGLVLILLEIVLKIAQPLALGKLITYFTPDQNTVTETDAYLYATVIVGSNFLNVLIAHSYMLGVQHLGMQVRVACCSLIYRKALKLSKTALAETTIGQMVNLLSNDVNRFDVAAINIHNLWLAPLETAIILYILYLQVGITAITGVGFLLLFIPLQMFLGKRTSVYRLRTALKTDERVRLMNEIISGIQVIKMYTWEKPFANLVAKARRVEIKQIKGAAYVKALTVSFPIFTSRIAIFLSILTYILLGNNVTAEYVFIVTAFYGILRTAMTIFFPFGVIQVAEASISIKRIKKFLLYEEIDVDSAAPEYRKPKSEGVKNGSVIHETNLINDKNGLNKFSKGIFVKNASASWLPLSSDDTLSDITFDIGLNQLSAIIGPVGCGKTSLLHVILKELPLKSGNLKVNGSISFASQEPWLFAGSVQQNILFGQTMVTERYQKVVRVCALERDFALFPYGDQTIVGEKGVTLSGGQKARINLARAVYKEADIYLLDDPLSAVDTHVGKQLFDDCVRGFLKTKCTILITHQLQYLSKVDRIHLLENGKIQASGTFQELQASGIDFAKELGAQTEEEKEEIDVISSSNVSLAKTKAPTENKEQRSTGDISLSVYTSYLKAGGNWCIVFVVFFLFIITQLAGSAGDYFITYWVNLEQKATEDNIKNNQSNTTSEETYSRELHMYIYSGLTIFTVLVTVVRAFSFFLFCLRSSTRLHNSMFTNIVHAAMRFFTLNSSGRILNRFSKDMGSIDEMLPTVIIDVLQIGLSVVGIATVIAIVNQWLLIPTVAVLILFYFLRTAYLCTSRNVKRLEGTTRSPVFAHISASLQGLTTIRAFGAQEILENEFDKHQDLHSSAWYMFLSCSRAFGFWLDLTCVVYIGIVTFSFLVLGTETFGGNVGLAITQSLGLMGMFQWGIRQWSELENQMTSVERVLEYTTVDREPQRTAIKPQKSWPENGDVDFQNLSLRYSVAEPYVLKNLTFSIKAKEKIGIVGRTGAGKSSLIYALFQLTPTEGAILIDNLKISQIPLDELRSKIAIIPQEPVLFSGTLRKNLDPFDEYTDNTIWNALEEVELKNVVGDLPQGLNNRMSEGGTNFSVGQRQLVCLARAIIRHNKILVLDEATANVDPQTDTLIQKTIRRKFAECTVLTIAHRLHTVMDSDKVLVMDSGEVVEFDHPHLLLQKKDGKFYGMVQQTGKAMTDTLINSAKESYEKKKRS